MENILSKKELPQALESVATPCYLYDLDILRATLAAIRREVPENDPSFRVHYAIKANGNPRLVKEIARHGFGADCVSGGEVKLALESGIPAERIVYAGVGKTDAEIEFAISEGIGCLNVESLPELEVINEIAGKLGKKADIALRVNPDIDAHTHEYITTGLEENKFGINLPLLPGVIKRMKEMENITFRGIHMHRGSQVLNMEPYALQCERARQIQEMFEKEGLTVESINVGGGLGIDYDAPEANPVPDFKAYFDTFRRNMMLREGQTLHFELGRAIVAQCGSLLARVLYVKEGVSRKYVILDAGMTELIRPALYGAHHVIRNLTSTSEQSDTYDVVGPVCESSDCFAKGEVLPVTHRGDLIAIRSAGAYGEAMSSGYNCRSLRPAIFVE